MEGFFHPDPLVRLPFYIAIGLIAEVLFTGIADLIAPNFLQSWNAKNLDSSSAAGRRDPRAMGYTFLWMIPIYGLLIFIEPTSKFLAAWPLWMRGFFYLGGFWITEYITGAIIKKLTGRCPWDYSYSKWSLHGYIRWDFAPFWYGFALFLEKYWMPKLIALTPALKAV